MVSRAGNPTNFSIADSSDIYDRILAAKVPAKNPTSAQYALALVQINKNLKPIPLESDERFNDFNINDNLDSDTLRIQAISHYQDKLDRERGKKNPDPFVIQELLKQINLKEKEEAKMSDDHFTKEIFDYISGGKLKDLFQKQGAEAAKVVEDYGNPKDNNGENSNYISSFLSSTNTSNELSQTRKGESYVVNGYFHPPTTLHWKQKVELKNPDEVNALPDDVLRGHIKNIIFNERNNKQFSYEVPYMNNKEGFKDTIDELSKQLMDIYKLSASREEKIDSINNLKQLHFKSQISGPLDIQHYLNFDTSNLLNMLDQYSLSKTSTGAKTAGGVVKNLAEVSIDKDFEKISNVKIGPNTVNFKNPEEFEKEQDKHTTLAETSLELQRTQVTKQKTVLHQNEPTGEPPLKKKREEISKKSMRGTEL